MLYSLAQHSTAQQVVYTFFQNTQKHLQLDLEVLCNG